SRTPAATSILSRHDALPIWATASRNQMSPDPRQHGPRTSARLRLALSYAAFLVFAGLVVLAGVYVVLRYVPYPRTVFPLAEGALARKRTRLNSSHVKYSYAV